MASLSNLIDLSLLRQFGELTIVPIHGAIGALFGAVEAMADSEIASASGAHSFRYYNNEFSYATRSYSAVTPAGTENPKAEGWFVLVEGEYVHTEDTTVQAGTTYYQQIVTWHTIPTGGGSSGEVEARLDDCEQNILALVLALSIEQGAKVDGTSDNIVVEVFDSTSGYIVSSGMYDSENHQIYA